MLLCSVLPALWHLQRWLKQANLVATRLATLCPKSPSCTLSLNPYTYADLLCLNSTEPTFPLNRVYYHSDYIHIIRYNTYMIYNIHNPPITNPPKDKIDSDSICVSSRRCLLGSHGMRPALGRWSEARGKTMVLWWMLQ